jgi:hypothetical protein
VTTTRAGDVGNVADKRDGRAVPEPNSTTRAGFVVRRMRQEKGGAAR